jgi:ubiquitin C-terminal hydrolase
MHNNEVAFEHALSIEIDNINICSIQDAIISFQQTEYVTVNCVDNKCSNKFGHKSIQLLESSNYLIVHLKRFKRFNKLSTKNKKNIFLNDKILIKNNHMEKCYSLISIVHHLGNDMNSGHYICQSLLNNV